MSMDVTLSAIGTVGTDVDFSGTDSYSYAHFRLACTPRLRRSGDWVDGETTWLNVRAAGRTAENVRDCVRKGDPVVVVGKLRAHVWTGEDGTRRDRLVLEAISIGHDLGRGTSIFTRTTERSKGDADNHEADPWQKLETPADPSVVRTGTDSQAA